MEQEIWVRAKIYGIDAYENFTPRVIIPGDCEDVAGPIDERFDPEDYVVSPRLALANGEFHGVALLKGVLRDGDIFVGDIRVGRAGNADDFDWNNGSLPVLDKDGGTVSRFVDSREKAERWAGRESEAGSLVLKKGDLQAGDYKDAASIRKDFKSYKMKRHAIDMINRLHLLEDRPRA